MSFWRKGLVYGSLFGVASLYCAVPVAAQDDAGAASDEQAAENREDDDIITVRARGQRDDAMAAFRNGDFELAEIEFQKNARCALRRERNLESAANDARRDAARVESSGAGQIGPSGASGPGQGGASQPSGVAGGAATDSITSDREAQPGRTCENRGFQLYMMGLSQLQLGKTDEALKNFKSATSKNKVLYDAHYRIALIALLNGDEKTARQELKKIETILRRCRDCEAKDDIIQRRDHLVKALSGDVELN